MVFSPDPSSFFLYKYWKEVFKCSEHMKTFCLQRPFPPPNFTAHEDSKDGTTTSRLRKWDLSEEQVIVQISPLPVDMLVWQSRFMSMQTPHVVFFLLVKTSENIKNTKHVPPYRLDHSSYILHVEFIDIKVKQGTFGQTCLGLQYYWLSWDINDMTLMSSSPCNSVVWVWGSCCSRESGASGFRLEHRIWSLSLNYQHEFLSRFISLNWSIGAFFSSSSSST